MLLLQCKLRTHLTILNWEYLPSLSFFEFQEELTLSNIDQYLCYTSCQKHRHFLKQPSLHFILDVPYLQLHIHCLPLYHIDKENWISITIIMIYIFAKSIEALSNQNHRKNAFLHRQRKEFLKHLLLPY